MQPKDLMREFHFTYADLDANKMGEISTSQNEKARQSRGLKIAGSIILAVIFLVGSAYLFISGMAASTTMLAVASGMILLALALGYYAVRTTQNLGKTLVLKQVKGSIKLEKRWEDNHEAGQHSGRYLYYMHVGQDRFHLKSSQYDVLAEGAVCTVYYETGYKGILSIEEQSA